MTKLKSTISDTLQTELFPAVVDKLFPAVLEDIVARLNAYAVS